MKERISLSRAADVFYAFRFLRLLTTPWTKTTAYKNGIIDKNGKVIKKPTTEDEKSSYDLFHRLVFNIKRLLNKIPFGSTTIASYAAALFLIKESFNLSDDQILDVMNSATGSNLTKEDFSSLVESSTFLKKGVYSHAELGIITLEEEQCVGHLFSFPLFAGRNKHGQRVVFCLTDSQIHPKSIL